MGVSSFWGVDPFTTAIVHTWSLDNYRTLWDEPAYRTIAVRTIGIAAAVTVSDAVLAFPLASFAKKDPAAEKQAIVNKMVASCKDDLAKTPALADMTDSGKL